MDQPGEHGRAADDTGGHDLGVTGLEQLLNRVERLLVDDRRHGDGDDLADRLQFLGLGPLVELMLAHIGAAGEYAVNLPDAPASAVACEDAAAVEIGDDVVDAHLAGRAVALQGEAIDQPHRLGVQRVDLQLLQAARLAIDFALPLLVGDGDIMLRLPRRRNAQVKGGAQRHGHG